MKKLSISFFAVLAIVFAVGSAFSTADPFTGFKANKDLSTQSASTIAPYESDITTEVNTDFAGVLADYAATYCDDLASSKACAARIVSDVVQSGWFLGDHQ